MRTTLDDAQPSWLLRLYNRAAASGRPNPPLSLDALREQAERASGQRFEPSDDQKAILSSFDQGLQTLARDDRLTPFGRLAATTITLRNLHNALTVDTAAREDASVAPTLSRPPVFIVGLYRSGTTKLHEWLAAHPALRAPRTWEMWHLMPRSRRSRRRDARQRWRVRLALSASRLAFPATRHTHVTYADGYEESVFLLENAGVLFSAWYAMGAFDHGRWLFEQDLTPAYRSLARQLNLVAGPLDPGRQWLLKCPLTTWFLDDLWRVFPGARLIVLHRPFARSVPSWCSHCAVLQRGALDRVDPLQNGRFFTTAFLDGLDRAYRARAAHPHEAVLDIHHAELAADPKATVARIVAWLDLAPMPHGWHPNPGPRSTHRYAPSQFGLDADELDAAQASVYARHGL